MQNEKVFLVHSPEELAIPVRDLLDHVQKPLADKGVIIFMNGPLGAGKTAFVQELAYQVGIEDRVQSPTFTLMKRYQVDSETIPELYTLIHIDAYRLEPHHREALRIEAFLKDPGTLVCVEWPSSANLDIRNAFACVDFEYMPEHMMQADIDEELQSNIENMRRVHIRYT